MNTQSVLVTGGTGFIGGWAIVALLSRGYHVRTTIRSADKEAWLRAQIATQIDADDRLSFALADLTDDTGWDSAVAGCDYVLHVAAPVGVKGARDPDDLIIPTRDGALRVLRASCRAGVKRIVLTSAVEACRPPMSSPDSVGDETRWTDPKDKRLGPYRLAKTLAERAAWDFMRNQAGATTLTTILPAAVLGPVFSADYAHALRLIQGMLTGQMPGIPRAGFCAVDVRDVVDLHILAMIAPEAAGERFIAASDWVWMSDMAEILRWTLGDDAQKVPKRKLPNFLVRLAALRDPSARFLVPLLGRKHEFTSAKAQEYLGWKPRSAKTTIIDTARSAIAVGTA
ncbi:NAD-dependent epimerase/dehydratase family protein [Alteraurantiacibacter aquimixticola]|uniref:NAD-dependent epimerase/dehydratase family protein n=1 Tax=Alteraurantiacibacter aquimixticola TaxID=2489173 RepID=A0A4T3F5N5_9SPHN|nr:NAD-dependent epimerase/dehydratase family protein [Alteraurantiacibacter aquimixticola]TIX50932.1 NAD-dependent epimerase/dehydratase family protein [Alteraurantiacibacter aquimixticola]